MKIEIDKFNSEIFKIKMGNIYLEDQDTELTVNNIEKMAKDNNYDHLTIKIPTNRKDIVNSFTYNNFQIADTLVEFIYNTKTELKNIDHKCILRDCKLEDLEMLKLIAKKSFEIDRFHSDEHLDNELCDLYYEKWIENSYYGFADKIIVAEYNGEPVGFTTGKISSNSIYAHLVLSAVSNKYRGIGVYTSMIHEGLRWVISNYSSKEGIIVGTQIDNIAVQKAWIKLGFTVFDSMYVMQKFIGDK